MVYLFDAGIRPTIIVLPYQKSRTFNIMKYQSLTLGLRVHAVAKGTLYYIYLFLIETKLFP